MAGFAINLRGLLEKPEVQVGLEENGSPNPLGYLETRLLQKFVTRETVECRGSMTEVRREGGGPLQLTFLISSRGLVAMVIYSPLLSL